MRNVTLYTLLSLDGVAEEPGAQTLLAADLVDRPELVVVPTLAGAGRRASI